MPPGSGSPPARKSRQVDGLDRTAAFVLFDPAQRQQVADQPGSCGRHSRSMMSRGNRPRIGVVAGRAAQGFDEPISAVSGVRNSWLTLATKSRRICSVSSSRERSSMLTPRRSGVAKSSRHHHLTRYPAGHRYSASHPARRSCPARTRPAPAFTSGGADGHEGPVATGTGPNSASAASFAPRMRDSLIDDQHRHWEPRAKAPADPGVDHSQPGPGTSPGDSGGIL